MSILFTFLKERFQLMPQWVQISTYLSFVILFIYLFTAPRFLDMRLVSNDYGDEFPIGGAQIEIEIEGRVLILLTDSKGRFSVPISTSAPIGSYLFILSPDSTSNKIKEIQVPVSNSYLKRSKIIYSKKNNAYQIVPNGIIQNTQQLLSSLRFISSAYADEKKDEITQEILRGLEVITKISAEQLSRNIALREDLGIDNIDLSYINNRLSKAFNIDILSKIQHKAKTVGDLIDIAQKVLSEKHPSKKIKVSPSSVVNSAKTRSFGISAVPTTAPELSSQLMIKYKLGKVLRKSERYLLAIEIFKHITQQQPSFYKAWFNLALSYEALGQNKSAETAFKLALQHASNEKDDRLYHAYGMFLFKQGRYKDAGKQFEHEERFLKEKEG